MWIASGEPATGRGLGATPAKVASAKLRHHMSWRAIVGDTRRDPSGISATDPVMNRGTISEMPSNLTVLQGLCAKTFTQESEVLQFMVEIRKTNDLRDKADKYQILVFFCDWLVHPVLTHKQAQNVLKGLDEFIDDAKRGKNVEEKHINFIAPLVSFKRLQLELAVFLSEHQLEASAVNGDEWFRFLSLYIDLIERAEVKSEDPAKLGLKHIDGINIKKSLITLGPPAGADEKFHFRVVWTFDLSGKFVGEISDEIWSPNTPQGTSVAVLNKLTFQDGTVKTIPLKSDTFFGQKK